MNESPRCPQCGALLLPNAPGGQCLRCLLAVDDDPTDDDAAEETPFVPEALATGQPPAGCIHYFGDYELFEKIGEGGMGKVWKARQVSLNRTVALKLIHAGRLAGPAEVARFRREAESAARLDHPNIVPIHEVGEHEGQQYFSMKLIEGETLAERLHRMGRPKAAPAAEPGGETDAGKRENEPDTPQPRPAHSLDAKPEGGRVGRYNPREAAVLLAKVARAVHHAHQRGIMHRDLKPANILLDANGEPHLGDFGLALLLESRGSLTGGVLGTPGYMAPEQLTGKSRDLTTAVDLYALGCILYELVTGRGPHQAETPAQALHKLANEEIKPPRQLNRSVDRDLETICLKCLAREPARRYESAAALAADLDRWLNHQPILARRYSPVERVWKWIRREPLKSTVVALIIIGPSFYAQVVLPWLSQEHHVITFGQTHQIQFAQLETHDPGRATENFAKQAFKPGGHWIKFQFLNVPPEIASNLLCRVMGDRMGWWDGVRTGSFRHGDTVFVPAPAWPDRNYYIGSVNWSVDAVLSNHPTATLRLTLVK